MRIKALALKLRTGSGLCYASQHAIIAGCQCSNQACLCPHALWNRSMHGDGVSPASWSTQTYRYWHSKKPQLFVHHPSFCIQQRGLCRDAVSDRETADNCEDHEVVGVSAALRSHAQRELNISASDAAAVVEGAPSFVRHLVALIKRKNLRQGDAFSQMVHDYFKDVPVSLLEPLLESTGATDEHLKDLRARLSTRNVQSLASFIRSLVKQGVPRSSLWLFISKDPQVLSCTEDEIEAGFKALREVKIPEADIIDVIQKYPLILTAEASSKISILYDELEEFISRNSIIRRAVCSNPQHVHEYKRGCAKEVVDYLKGFDFTVLRLDEILQKHARLILTDVEKKLKQNVQFLEDVGMCKEWIYKVISRCPNFLFYSLEDNLEAKLAYFKQLGFEEPEFCQVINRFPKLFSASLENKIKPAVEELQTLGLSDAGLRKVVLYRPLLFGYKLGGAISGIVKQLNESKYPEDSKVTAFIKLYSRSAEHKQKCEDCLVKHGLSVVEAKGVLEKEPGILGYNEYVLNEKLESLKAFDIRVQTVLTVPEYLSFALRKRIQRRERVLAYMKLNNLLSCDVTLKHLVLHSNTHFYKVFVKPHFENKELCNIWYRERGAACIATTSITALKSLEAQETSEL